MQAEFDTWPDPPANVLHVGPVFEEAEPAEAELPWAADNNDPLAVVTFSTQYVHQESFLERIIGALDGLNCRVLLTTGFELTADEVPVLTAVVVRD